MRDTTWETFDPDDDVDAYAPFLARAHRRERKRDTRTSKGDVRHAEVAEVTRGTTADGGLESGFATTYRPGRFEEGWLLESLQGFYEDALIADVLALIKGGKEANVYLCRANRETGLDLLAAKVYRPRKFRNLRNDVMYREGREILSSEGGVVKRRDGRAMRAMKNKTALGAQMLHQSWILFEHGTLRRLHQLRAPVPKPIACGSNAILMEYIGEEGAAAPVLHSVRLDREEAPQLFDQVIESVDLMLSEGMIHGDLSAFNVLYWKGEITLIDFPQVTMAHTNRNGYAILQRDVLRVCEYFRKQGVPSDPTAIAEQLWHEHRGEEPLMQDGMDEPHP